MEFSENQKNAVIWLTIAAGVAIIVIGLSTYFRFSSSLPPAPSLVTTTGRNAQAVKDEIENYKSLVTVQKDNQAYLNELLVTKLLKGLFDTLLTAVIAYVFARPVVTAFAERLKSKNNSH